MATQIVRNGQLIDGNGGDPIANGAVLVVDGQISAVGADGSFSVPDDAVEIDAGGGTILPGLIDTHVHITGEGMNLASLLTTPFSYRFYETIGYMRKTLDVGITTIRDAGGADAGIKMAVENGLITGPRMQISISVLSTTGGHGDGWMLSGNNVMMMPPYPGNPDGICDGPEEVRKKVREVLRAGAEVIKVCSTGGVGSPTDHPNFTQFSIEELKIMVEEAHFHGGLKVMSHAQGAEGIKNAVLAGIHSIEHGIFLDDEAIELMLEHGTFLVPTLVAPLGVLESVEQGNAAPEYALRKARESVQAHKDSIARAYQAGVKIAMGTDAAVMPHGTNLRELGLMCDAGMSPMESLVATTKVAADCLGWQDRVGTLEVGKYGDVVITRTDPLADIRSLEDTNNIAFVMKGGDVVKDIRNA
ncbi:MAG: amidohydrolase family protein [Thermomicrobiales bacterium]|nr:amidohydrolase family protein [Thermomicrobiales bacterium]